MSVDGVNTAALTIFINMLSKYVKQVSPTHMAVCWDAGHRIRDEIYPEYKAKRAKHVDDGEDDDQTPWGQAKEFCTLAGIPHLARPQWEADDLIAVITKEAPPEARPVHILSVDKDLLQLVDRDVTQIRPGVSGPGGEVWTVPRVSTEMGLHPSQIPLYMALTGDQGDGVPGVRGIGPKKALALLEKAEMDWDKTIDLLDEQDRVMAVTSRRLVDLRYPEFAAWADDWTRWGEDIRAPKFHPTLPGSMLWEPRMSFLSKWQMNSAIQRLREGSLWYEGGPDLDASALVFDQAGPFG